MIESPEDLPVRVPLSACRGKAETRVALLDITAIKHHDDDMRTTLTVDDDVAVELQRLAHTTRRGFKSIVNELLRRGLAAGARPIPAADRFVVKARACGFLPGIDPLKLNQLADEIETDGFVERHRRARGRS